MTKYDLNLAILKANQLECVRNMCAPTIIRQQPFMSWSSTTCQQTIKIINFLYKSRVYINLGYPSILFHSFYYMYSLFTSSHQPYNQLFRHICAH